MLRFLIFHHSNCLLTFIGTFSNTQCPIKNALFTPSKYHDHALLSGQNTVTAHPRLPAPQC
jgi:hypothetical protein